MAGISSPGIGSGLDVNAIVSKLMSVEAAPLAAFDKRTASYQAKVSALGTLSSAVGTFQGSLSGLLSLTGFQSLTSTSTNTNVLVGSATSKAKAGTYKIDVTQVAQAQTLASAGHAKSSAAIGLGATTTVSFQFGAVSGGSFGVAGAALAAGVASGGITPGALTINNTRITTDSSVKNAKLLADAINAKSETTGVSATASTSTGATLFGANGAGTFGAVDTGAGGVYALSVGGVEIASQAAGVAAGDGVTAATLDATLADTDGSVFKALEAAGIGVTGLASDGTLRFTNADGANIAVTEDATGAADGVTGGIGKAGGEVNAGSSVTASGTLALVSADASQIRIGGTNPAAAGLAAGSAGAYLDAAFTQDGTKSSGSIVIDSTNNSLEGIREAINKGNFGVTATIVNDGGSTPYHLVLNSTQTGAASSMKISLNGSGAVPADPDLVALLGYDPEGVQNLSQNASAQSTLLNVNGIEVASETTSVAGAIEGVTLTIGTPGSASLIVAKDSSSLTGVVNGFVKAYNDLNNQIKTLTGYNAETKAGGPLLGDSTAQAVHAQVRRAMSQSITGLTGNLNTLSQIGIAFQKDGSLVLDSGKLQKAITDNFSDIASLFAAVGKSTDTLVSYTSSTSATKAGSYALHISTMASQGSVQGGSPLAASTVIDNDTTWNVTLNDVDPPVAANTATITIPAGSYTPTQMASMLQSAINGASAFSGAGSAVTATVETDGSLKLVSNRYGSKSNILVLDKTGSTVDGVLFGAAAQKGVDVAGTIGGYAATGVGQTLTGEPGGPAEGLKLSVTGGDAGSRGTIGFSQGYAYQLNNLATAFLGNKGLIAGRTTGINQTIKDIGKQSAAFSAKLVDIEKRYRAQYSALDTMIASMNTTTSFLTQQFAAMSANN